MSRKILKLVSYTVERRKKKLGQERKEYGETPEPIQKGGGSWQVSFRPGGQVTEQGKRKNQ